MGLNWNDWAHEGRIHPLRSLYLAVSADPQHCCLRLLTALRSGLPVSSFLPLEFSELNVLAHIPIMRMVVSVVVISSANSTDRCHTWDKPYEFRKMSEALLPQVPRTIAQDASLCLLLPPRLLLLLLLLLR